MKNKFAIFGTLFLIINACGWLGLIAKQKSQGIIALRGAPAREINGATKTPPIVKEKAPFKEIAEQKEKEVAPVPLLIVRSDSYASSFGGCDVSIYFNAQVEDKDLDNAISIEPKVKYSATVDRWEKSIELFGEFKPESEYKITISTNVVYIDKEGSASPTEPLSTTVKIKSRPSDVKFVNTGKIMTPDEDAIVPVKFVNVTNVEFSVSKLLPQHLYTFIRLLETSGSDLGFKSVDRYRGYMYSDMDVLEDLSLEPKKYNCVLCDKLTSDIKITPFSLTKYTNGEKGTFLLNMSGTNFRDLSIVSITDLAISTFIDSSNTYVRVNSIKSTDAIAGVNISLLSKKRGAVAETTTDERGIAVLPSCEDPLAIVAKTDDDISFLVLNEKSHTSVVGKSVLGKNALNAFLFSERGIYRPGDTINLQAILRNDNFEAPEEIPCRITITKVGGYKPLSEVSVKSDKNGSAFATMEIPEGTASGKYVAHICPPGKDTENAYGVTYFNVESFVPPTVSVAVEGAQEEDNLHIVSTVKYLYGSPAANMKSTITINFATAKFAPENYADYKFCQNVESRYGVNENLANYKRTLRDEDRSNNDTFTDVNGKIDRIIYSLPKCKCPFEATTEITVFEDSGRSVSAHTTTLLNNNDYYIGIKSLGKVANEEKFDIVLVDKNGKPFTTDKELNIRVTKCVEDWSFLINNASGNWEWKCTKNEYDMDKQTISTKDGHASYSYTTTSVGKYFVIISSPDAITSISFYADGEENSDIITKSEMKFELDKEEYNVGDIAHVTLKTPFAGSLWLAQAQKVIEKEDIMAAEKGIYAFDIEITEEMKPQLILAASLVRSVAPEEMWTSHREVASITLPIKSNKNILSLSLSIPERIRPSATFPVEISVLHKDGGAPVDDGTVSLFVVDEAILQLTDMETPVPENYLLGTRFADFRYHDFYGDLMRVTDKKLLGYISHTGGDDDAALYKSLLKRTNPIKSKRFKLLSTAYPLIPLKDGKATVNVTLPEFTGKARFFAVANTKTETGSTEKKAEIHRDTIVIPDLPRFLAPGDKSILTISIENTTDVQKNIAINLSSQGPINLADYSSIQASLLPHEHKILTIPLTAQNSCGNASITLSTTTESETFQSTLEIPVRPAAALSKETSIDVIEPNATFTLPALQNCIESSVERSIETFSLPITEMRSAFSYLSTYPYGCLEQTTSCAFPYLYAAKLPKGCLTEKEQASAATIVTNAFFRIGKMYRCIDYTPEGFAMWPDSSFDWHCCEYSLYAIRFIAEAKRQGFCEEFFPFYTLSGIIRNIRKFAARDEINSLTAIDLALIGEPDLELMMEIEKDPNLSSLTLARLAYAYTIMQKPAKVREMLNRISSYEDIETIKELICVYSVIDPTSKELTKLIRILSSMYDPSKGHFSCTYDNANAFIAYATYLAHQPNVSNDPVNAEIKRDSDAPNSPVHITNKGANRIYLRSTTSSIPLTSNLPEVAEGLRITRTLYTEDGALADISKIKRGEIYVVKVTIVPLRNTFGMVLVEDLLPAGFECCNKDATAQYEWIQKMLSKETNIVLSPEHIDAKDDRILLFTEQNLFEASINICHHFYTVRAVSPGTFIYPAITAEAMYDPYTFSRTTPQTLTIIDEK